MKKSKLIYLLGCSLISLTLIGCSTNNNNSGDIIVEIANIDDVRDYNNSLVNATEKCMANFEESRDLYNNYKSGDTTDIRDAINNTITECENTIKEINRIGNREGDSSLKNSIIPIIEKYITYQNQLNDILPLLEKGDDVSIDESTQYEDMIKNLNSISQEIKNMNISLSETQKDFAKNYEYELADE